MSDNGMEHKAVGVAGFKILDEESGVVETVVSVTGIVDRVKDDILPGAYEKTLMARTPKGVWSHDWEVPVSKTLHAEELHPGDARLPKTTAKGDPWPNTAGGLLIRTQFNLETQRGREAFSDVKFYGPEQEWSVGYKVPLGKSSVDKKTGVRNIEEMDLYEYSPVLFGAMPLATTVSVKELTEAVTHELLGKAADDVIPAGGTRFDVENPDNPNVVHDYVDEDENGHCDTCGVAKEDHDQAMAQIAEGTKAVPANTYGKPGYATQGRPTLDPGGSVGSRAPVPNGAGDSTSQRLESDTGAGKPGFGSVGAGSLQSPSVEGQKPSPSGAGQGSGSVADDSQTARGTPGPGGKPAQGDVQSPSVGAQAPSPDGQGDAPDEPTTDATQTQHEFVADDDGDCKVCGNNQNFWLHFGYVHGPAGDAPVTPNGGSVPANTYGKPGGKSEPSEHAKAFLIALDDDEVADLEAAIAERKDAAPHTTHKFQPSSGTPGAPCGKCGKGEGADIHHAYSTADPDPSSKSGNSCTTCGGSITKSADGRWHHASGDDKDHQAKPGTKDELAELDEKIGRMLSGSNAKKVQAAWTALRDLLTSAGVDLGDAPAAVATVTAGKADLRVIEPGEELDGSESLITEAELMELATLRASA